MSGLHLVFDLWWSALAFSLGYTLFVVLVARFAGARVDALAVFMGPKLLAARVAGLEAQLRAIPIPTAEVRFASVADVADDEDERTSLDVLSRPKRLAVLALPWVLLLGVCATLLGPFAAAGAFARGFVQFPAGALAPTSTGVTLLAALTHRHAVLSPWAFAALLATKLIAFNLLPIPGLSGFSIVYRVLATGSVPPAPVRIAGMVATLGLAGGWVWAVFVFATA